MIAGRRRVFVCLFVYRSTVYCNRMRESALSAIQLCEQLRFKVGCVVAMRCGAVCRRLAPSRDQQRDRGRTPRAAAHTPTTVTASHPSPPRYQRIIIDRLSYIARIVCLDKHADIARRDSSRAQCELITVITLMFDVDVKKPHVISLVYT